jgi:hypothetical protein
MKLALGTVQFGMNYGVANATGRVSNDVARLILKKAFDLGLGTLDTATAYGDCESTLGELGVENWRVISKLQEVPDDCSDVEEWVFNQVKNSLKRLRIQKLHGLLLHRPVQLFEALGPELYSALQSLKKKGLVSKVGISVYEVSELASIWSNYSFDLVQAPLNILDRRFVDSGWALKLKNAGVEIHTRSAFLQGLLLMPLEKRPTQFKPWHTIWAEWDRWLLATGYTPLQACLRFVLEMDCVDCVVVGVDGIEQFEEIVQSATGTLESLPVFEALTDERLLNPATWSEL